MRKILLMLLLGSTIAANAQRNSRIVGVVLDSVTQKPVEFATVALHQLPGDKLVNGSACDEKGKFVIPNVPKGTYRLIISFVGYHNHAVEISISEKGGDASVGPLYISPFAEMLKEIVVEGVKTLVEEKVDRTIYNAEQDATTKGGDAADVLKRVPMLTVDADGNVALRGSANVRVLINNKPSSIAASSVADALKQIPADMIKTVEVITSPSARYDAEGSAGIINIVLKKNTLDGMFFNADVTAGTRGSNLGLNGAYRKGKMGLSLGGFIRPTYNVIGDFANDQVTHANDTLHNTQSAHTRNDGLQGTYTLVWDYDINKNTFLSTTLRYGHRDQNNYQDNLFTNTFRHDSLKASSLQNIRSVNNGNNVDASLTFVRRFDKKDRELNFLGVFTRNNQSNGYVINTVSPLDESLLNRHKNDNPGYTQESVLQLDYQEPLAKNQLIEFGAKTTIRDVKTDYTYYVAGATGDYIVDLTRAPAGFNYNQTISAGYLAYSTEFNGFTVKAGSRYEYTTIQAHFDGQPNITIPSYGVMVPSINLSRKLKDGNLLKISYNRRIQRPSLRDLNPNLQASNPKSASQGNPNLKPEYTDLYEVAYKTNIKNATINMSAFVRYNTNDIQPARIIRHDTIISVAQNIGTEANYGLSFFVNIPVSNRLTINGGSDTFYRVLQNNSGDVTLRTSNSGITPNFRLSGNYTFPNGWSMQMFGSYQGWSYNLQGYRTSPINHSVSVRKNLFGNNGSFSFGLDNFATPSYQVYSKLNSTYLSQTSTNTLHNLIAKMSFSYKIGKISQSKKKQLVEEED